MPGVASVAITAMGPLPSDRGDDAREALGDYVGEDTGETRVLPH